MAHVFIVNEKTFKVHLENMFAGTGNSIQDIYFITANGTTTASSSQQKNAILMFSDLERIRIGDEIIFFVTGISKFYGIFKAASEVFVDDVLNNYLGNRLSKKLTYRILIKPYIVYEEGISEYQFLDSLENIRAPQEMCWSLIYRKLLGKRGCTPITDFEYDRFVKLIKLQNNNIDLKGNSYTFLNKKIASQESKTPQYRGKKINPRPQLLSNMYNRYSKSFEHYLQFLTLNTLKNKPSQIVSQNLPIKWIGNEVSCGTGMQKIDIVSIQIDAVFKDVYISIIELKDETLKKSITDQIDRYLKWIFDYIVPTYIKNKYKVFVEPIIIAKPFKSEKKQSAVNSSIMSTSWSRYDTEKVKVLETKIINMTLDDKNKKVIYLIKKAD